METVLDIINIAPSTKNEAELFAGKLTELVFAGNENPLHLFVKMNAIVKALDIVKKNINQYAVDEAHKQGTKAFDYMGAKVEISELGTKYDFTPCKDPEWNEANEQATKWDEKKKEREKFLKALTKPLDIIVEGEPITIQPPHKSSTTGLKITLK